MHRRASRSPRSFASSAGCARLARTERTAPVIPRAPNAGTRVPAIIPPRILCFLVAFPVEARGKPPVRSLRGGHGADRGESARIRAKRAGAFDLATAHFSEERGLSQALVSSSGIIRRGERKRVAKQDGRRCTSGRERMQQRRDRALGIFISIKFFLVISRNALPLPPASSPTARGEQERARQSLSL